MKIHHIGYLVSDIKLAIKQFEEIGGTLKDPVVFDKNRLVDIAFIEMGGQYLLELVSPHEESKAVGKALRRLKNTPYHLCFECNNDLDEEIRAFVSKGCMVVEEPSIAVAIQNRRVAFLYSAEIGLFELVE